MSEQVANNPTTSPPLSSSSPSSSTPDVTVAINDTVTAPLAPNENVTISIPDDYQELAVTTNNNSHNNINNNSNNNNNNNNSTINEKDPQLAANSIFTNDTDTPAIPDEPNNPPNPGGSGRLVSLDALRGLTVCLMILANYQVEEEAFSYLLHPAWTGFTIADSVFPNFLFVMGLAIPLAGRRLKGTRMQVATRIMKRTSLLILLGMFITNFPFNAPEIASTWRPSGVLQRLGIAYAVCAGAFAWLRPDVPPPATDPEALAGLTIMQKARRHLRHLAFNVGFPTTALAMWLALTFGVNVPGCGRGHLDMECTTEAYFDSSIFGPNHNYQGKAFDPEGSLSHVTATLSCYLGVRVGIQVMKGREELKTSFGQLAHMTSWSLLSGTFALIAYLFKPVIPLSKPLWTPTFALFAGAISLMELSAMTYIVDYAKLGESTSALVAKPVNIILNACLAVGKNPLAIYMASELIAASCMSIPIPPGANGEERSLWSVLFQYVFATWLPIRLNSLVWSGAWIVLLYAPLAMFMDRRGWYFKI